MQLLSSQMPCTYLAGQWTTIFAVVKCTDSRYLGGGAGPRWASDLDVHAGVDSALIWGTWGGGNT